MSAASLPARLAALDLGAPWFQPWAVAGRPLAALVQSGPSLDQALNARAGPGIRFVPSGHMPAGKAYEQYIFETRCCPVREDLHDFFNGLVWLQMPLTKTRLNQLQAAQIASDGIGSTRGPVRDAITVFDENAALLHAPQPLWDALERRDWLRLFVELRPLWQQARLVLFGHALLEKLAAPRKQITAHVWHAQAPRGGLADLDGWLASQLSAKRLAAKPFMPLPVLGVPGWWHENENFSFYDDSLVFRPRRAPQRPHNIASATPLRP